MIEDIEDNVGHASVAGDETAKPTAASSKDKGVVRVIRNFTYELHDVENVFTSKVSFFFKRIKQTN